MAKARKGRRATAGKRKSSKTNPGKKAAVARKPSTSTVKPGKATPAKLLRSIDQTDREILKALAERVRLVKQLSQLDTGDVAGRVAESNRRIESLVEGKANSIAGLEPEAKAGLLRHASSLCLQTLHELRVAYLGPMHSYSHLAAIKYFGDAANFAPVASIPAVFDAVSRRDAATGIVPIENSTDGRVVDTLGMFIRREMQICGEVLLPIHHNLLSRTPRQEITEVYSKPQALSQCRSWLANQLPQAKLMEISSTAAAARLAAEKPGAAAVASLEAGRVYELDVIDASIEDNPNNVTRFAVLGREQPAPTGDDKTALLFQVHHKPGALADVMAIFKGGRLNLTWIESFPKPGTQSEYLFFVELTGHREDKAVASAISTLSEQTERLEVLGSYPRAMLE